MNKVCRCCGQSKPRCSGFPRWGVNCNECIGAGRAKGPQTGQVEAQEPELPQTQPTGRSAAPRRRCGGKVPRKAVLA